MRLWTLMLAVMFLPVSAYARSPQRLAELLAEMNILGSTPERQAAIDREAAQKDAWRSGLFWYTDFNQALAAAKSSGKPILSLRLLGRLDEELSCANSRFFRKTLYVDPNISSLLRSRYILHWESVRPVPIVTIDYGDGMVVKRTLTGNSIHYLLAPDGRVIDALPGLLNADTFERELIVFADQIQGNLQNNPDKLAAYRQRTIIRLAAVPVRAQRPVRLAERAMVETRTKAVSQTAMLAGTRNPSQFVQADTLHNQQVLRPKILHWLGNQPDISLRALNERVYAELFITPLNDPLMGLNMPDEAALMPDTRPQASPPAGNSGL